jgi:anti-anti-sigma factor
MAINVRQKDDVVIVKPSGRLFGPAALDFKKVLDAELSKIPEGPKFLIDFADVAMVGSSGLGALMGAHVAIESKGGFMAIANVGTNIENLMIRSRLFDTFEHFESEDEAIEALTAE